MVVMMTREEYERTYGVAPVLPNPSKVDTTPAPRRMTMAEYQAEYGKKDKKNFLTSTEPSFKASEGGAGSIVPNITKTFGNIPSSARNLARFTAEPVNPLDLDSPMNIGSNLVKSAVATKDIFKEQGLKEGIKSVGAGIKDTAKKGVDLWKKAGESIYGNLEKNVMDSGSTAKGTGTSIGEGVSKIAKLGIEDPLLIPSALYGGPQAVGSKADEISRLAQTVTRGADTSLSNVANKAKNAYSDLNAGRTAAKNAKATSVIEEEIYNIENNYSKTRKANDYSKDSGASSRRRIAETDVLADSVDENGLIRTQQPGGAVERYTKQTIDGREGVVRQNLVREGAKVNLKEVERELSIALQDSTLEGADLIAALNGVKKEIAGLKLRADEFGDVLLEKIHDAKINTTKNINFQTPPETATYRKAVARTYKEIVENKSKTNVREVNKELSKYYEDIERLKALDGKRVRGGKLGKYTAQIAGNIVGGAAGGAVGGMTGAAIGALVGGETSAFIKGKTMAGTFGKERGMPVVKNPVLEKALADSKLPPQMDLTKPDARVGVKKNIPKTPEITKLEGQIAKNVAAQKAAIKAGDFTLVAKLKEVYQHLVAKLKEIIQTIKDTPNKQGGFIKNPLSPNAKSGKSPRGQSQQLSPSSNDTKAFKNFNDLSTKLLGKLEGRKTVSKQFISDMTNSPDLKQAERELFRRVLADYKDGDIPVKDFANKVKSELLPLKTKGSSTLTEHDFSKIPQRYESITLPDELRGPIANYEERVYESPIKTSAGNVHFSNHSPNYFAHTRIEDLPVPKVEGASTAKEAFGLTGGTRRIIEIQSDLFQKGRLEGELGADIYRMNDERVSKYLKSKFGEKFWEKNPKLQSMGGIREFLKENNPKLLDEVEDVSKRKDELSKLEPYRNTWHERVIREEIKRAAQDGKTKLQFPTGETAMKIEGLGESNSFWDLTKRDTRLTPENLKIGNEIRQVGAGTADDWIITDVLGDGKFKAVPKTNYVKWMLGSTGRKALETSEDAFIKSFPENAKESFDISGNIDTNNPIYKFYEKEVGRYLTNKYGAKRIKDAQGVEWYEVGVDKKMAELPIEAFAAAPLLLDNDE